MIGRRRLGRTDLAISRVGARTAKQVDGWIDGAKTRLTGIDIDLIARAIEETGAGSGRVRPPTATSARSGDRSQMVAGRITADHSSSRYAPIIDSICEFGAY